MAKAKQVKVPAHTLRYWAAEAYRQWMYRGGPCVAREFKTVQGVTLTVQVIPGTPTMVKIMWSSPGKVMVKELRAARSWLH